MGFPIRYVTHSIIDGIVTGFGAVLGASVTGDPSIVIITGLAASISCTIADVTSIYSSTEAHHSIVKAAKKTGIDIPVIVFSANTLETTGIGVL